MTDPTATSPRVVDVLAGLDDIALIEACRLDPHVFAEVVRRHQRLVFGAAFRIVKDATAAEDIAQEAFLRAFKAVDDYRGEGALGAWLYRISRNLALNVVSRSQETPTEEMADLLDPAHTPEAEAIRREDIRAVQVALREIPELLRRPLVMREYQHMTYEDIAEAIGIPLNTVRSRIFRAKRALETQLEGRPA
jgi:RNA polymerase sigma-70 factor (ECF subfamily)